MGSLRWGILGPGGIAQLFAHDLNAVGLDLRAVGSRSRENADAFARKHNVANAHGSYEALVADPDVDAIYIATPHRLHAEHAELAMRAGKHVLIEKPMALNAHQARRIQHVAAETGLFAMEAMRTRFMPHTLRIHELLAEGALGVVRTFIADHNQSLDRNPVGRLWNPELGGGALLDLGIYNLSFASDFLGQPSSITASARMTDTGVDAQTSMIFDYDSGAQANLQTAMDVHGPNRAVLIGEKARIEIAPRFYKSSKFQLIDPDENVIEDFHQPYPYWGKQYEAWEVERCVTAGLTESPRMTLAETVAIHETMDAVREKIGLRYPGEE